MANRRDIATLRDAVHDLRRAVNTAQHLTSKDKPLHKRRLMDEAGRVQEKCRRFSKAGEGLLSIDRLYLVLNASLHVVGLANCKKADRLLECRDARRALERACW
jgi:hypothetical protein